MKFYKCNNCESVALEVLAAECAGEKDFREMTANTTEAVVEKHLPAVEREGNKLIVTVGSVEHPMLEEHFIMLIYLETCRGGMFKRLKPGEAPRVEFEIPEGETPKAVYEYCNIHGLWKTELS